MLEVVLSREKCAVAVAVAVARLEIWLCREISLETRCQDTHVISPIWPPRCEKGLEASIYFDISLLASPLLTFFLTLYYNS